MLKILVVEDDDPLRQILERMLARDGHAVTTAGNGAQALQVLENSSFDLLITDLVMPEMEGLQLLRVLRRKTAPPKVIAISGGGRGSSNDYLELAQLFGADATLAKPFTPEALVNTIAKVMGP